MILADTSAWVEYLRATGSPVHLRLRELIDAEGDLRTTEVVMMELLAGATTPEGVAQLRRLAIFGVVKAPDPGGELRHHLADRRAALAGTAGEFELAILGEGADICIPVAVIDREQIARHQILDLGTVLRV